MAGHSRVSTVHGNRFRAAEHYREIFSAVNVKRIATLALLATTPALQPPPTVGACTTRIVAAILPGWAGDHRPPLLARRPALYERNGDIVLVDWIPGWSLKQQVG